MKIKQFQKSGVNFKPFGKLITSITGGATPLKSDEQQYASEGIKLLRIQNISEHGVVLDDLAYITPEVHSALLGRSQLAASDLLMTITGRIGTASVVESQHLPANINQHIVRIRLNTEEVTPEFIKEYLNTGTGRLFPNRGVTGTTRTALDYESIRAIPICFPPLSIQRALVVEMDAARESRRRKLAKADALLSGLDAYLLAKLGLPVPEEQENKVFAIRLADLKGHRMDALAYKPFFAKGHHLKTPVQPLLYLAKIDPPTGKRPSDETSLVPYVGLPECDLTEIREVAMRPYSEVKGRRAFMAGDILFARIEPSVFNKKYVLAEDLKGHEFAFTSTEFYVVRPRENIGRYFLYSMFFCSFVFAQVRGKTTGSSGRRRIDPELFANLMIPTPPKLMQEKMAEEVIRRRTEARRLRVEAAREWDAAKARFEAKLLGKVLDK